MPPEIRHLLDKWRKEADDIEADGDICCALTRRHDADALEAALLVLPADLPPPESRPVCTCGSLDFQSARWRHSHLSWCAAFPALPPPVDPPLVRFRDTDGVLMELVDDLDPPVEPPPPRMTDEARACDGFLTGCEAMQAAGYFLHNRHGALDAEGFTEAACIGMNAVLKKFATPPAPQDARLLKDWREQDEALQAIYGLCGTDAGVSCPADVVRIVTNYIEHLRAPQDETGVD